MRGLVFVVIVLLAVACNGGEEAPRTATPEPSPEATPAATATPQATPTATPAAPATGAPQIAYVGPNGQDIYLAAADGSGKRNPTEDRCLGRSKLYWSPLGDRLACIGSVDDRQAETRVLVFDLDGRVLLRLQHAGYFLGFAWENKSPASLWSPSGERLAYVVHEHVPWAEGDEPESPEARILIVADATRGMVASIPGGQLPRWSGDRDRLAYYQAVDDALAVYDAASGQEESLGNDLRPLAWVLDGKALLVAANYQPPEDFRIPTLSEANLLNVATGEMTRIPELDNLTQFWLSPDGVTAVVRKPSAGLPSLAILNLSSRQFTPIADSVIGYPSDFIPQSQLAFSSDGSQVYWADQGGWAPPAIYKANIDGTGLTEVAQLPGWFGAFSPDVTEFLYFVHSDAGAELWVANIDGSDPRLLAEDFSGAAWRPTP